MTAAQTERAPLLEVERCSKTYGDTMALRDVSLSLQGREVLCLLGPSGCGKSTLLRIIAGLERADTGRVCFGGQPIDHLPVHQRGFGLMFQDFALFPHRTVGENVAFGLRMQKQPREAIERRVRQTLELVELGGYDRRTIYELSGGERQRVALARSLAPEPRLLMLDEPLGSLDRTLREQLTDELRELIKRLGLTVISVTHDQAEAFTIADRIALMRAGRIEQIDSPLNLYRNPRSAFAARFLGLNTLIPGELKGVEGQHSLVTTALGTLRVQRQPGQPPAGAAVLVLVRPEAVELGREERDNLVVGTITRRSFRGAHERIVLQHQSGISLELDLPAGLAMGQSSLTVGLLPGGLSLIQPGEPAGSAEA